MSAPAASPRTPSDHRAEELRVWLALLVVYVVWGSTYLAIRIVVADLPPLLSAGLRFLLAGSVVALAVAIRSGPGRLRVGRRRLASAALVGALLLLGGNGLVVLAEQTVPSALTALVIASTPIWVVVLRTITGDRVARGTLLGVAVGFVGVGVLVVPTGLSGSVVPVGLGMLILASICWATGSFVSSRLPLPADPFVSTSYQMVVGGALMLVAGTLRGEPFAPATWVETPDALLALGYLVVFGSLAAFSAYTWLLQHAPISRVATYAYVNPVVAVVLGAVILSESITPAMLVGGAVIVTGVALIIRHETGVRRAREEAAAAAASSQSIEEEAETETVPAG